MKYPYDWRAHERHEKDFDFALTTSGGKFFPGTRRVQTFRAEAFRQEFQKLGHDDSAWGRCKCQLPKDSKEHP